MYAVPCRLVQLLCQCVEEVGFDCSVQSGDVITARRHLARLRSLDQESALLRSATSAFTLHMIGLLRRICTYMYSVHVHKAKQGKVNGSTQGRQLISKKKAELP